MSNDEVIEQNDQPVAEKRPMTVQEMGHKGGSTTRDRHGSEHYARIGRKGALTRNGWVKPIPEGRSDNRGGVRKGTRGAKDWAPPEGTPGK